MVIQKWLDTMDNRLIQMKKLLTERPLEKNLGFMDFGKYKLENSNVDHAFTKPKDTRNQEIGSSSGEEYSDTESYESDDNDDENNNDCDTNNDQETSRYKEGKEHTRPTQRGR